jgi:hypothetical protein
MPAHGKQSTAEHKLNEEDLELQATAAPRWDACPGLQKVGQNIRQYNLHPPHTGGQLGMCAAQLVIRYCAHGRATLPIRLVLSVSMPMVGLVACAWLVELTGARFRPTSEG